MAMICMAGRLIAMKHYNITHGFKHCMNKCVSLFIAALLWIPCSISIGVAADNLSQPGGDSPTSPISKGTFLVASKKLANSSFRETVILITHYSQYGTSGLAVNRPSKFALNKVFPQLKQLQDNEDELYLGGPVSSDSIFVLLQTRQPAEGMQKITDDFYFSPGIQSLTHNKPGADTQKNTRAFAGYSGWTPGQLENEIRRGDWLVIQSDPKIIFSQDDESLWKQLHHIWSGTWI